MRRSAFVLLMLFVASGLFLTASCQRENALRIVSINEGEPVVSDLVDFGMIITRDDEGAVETTFVTVTPNDIVTMELQYVEIGLGLPTWTPYTAHVTKITVRYDDASVTPPTGEEPVPYTSTTLPADITIESDVELRNSTTASFSIVPAGWKEYYFGDEAQDEWDDDDFGVKAHLNATVRVEGIDLASGDDVRGEGEIEILIGNYWDDPDRLEQ